ncbi:vitamin K epoxide reductase family protein [Aquiflexum sp.]|uniref:vitamin K epoxide reductase family protein n=1 Tax=Aquiflexum sp. TaxID=1872584 RepID=UPI00359315F4
MDNCFISSRLVLKLLNLKHTDQYLQDCLLSHPDHPSLLCIADTMEKYGVINHAVKIDKSDFKNIPTPAIVQVMKHGQSKFCVLKEIEGNYVTFFDENGAIAHKENSEFIKDWTGVSLLVEKTETSKEENIDQKIRRKILAGIHSGILALTVIAWIVISIFWSSDNGSLLLEKSVMAILKISGLVTSIFLLWFEVDQYNPILQKICSNNKKVNCNAVLTSKYAYLPGTSISLSSLVFAYFFASLTYLMVQGFSYGSLLAIGAISFLTIPFLFISFYFQAVVIKNWCKFCLVIQGILLLEVCTAYFFKVYNAIIPFGHIILIFSLFFIPMVGWFYLKPVLEKAKERDLYKNNLSKLKNNKTVFGSLLVKSRQVNNNPDNLGIILKNNNAKHKVIKVCNPYCGPCAKAHPILDSLFEKGIIDLQIIFTATTQNILAKPVSHFLAIEEKSKDRPLIKIALDDWYNAENKDYETFSKRYPMNGELDQQDNKIQKMRAWCEAEHIIYTPTIFIDGYKLPDQYAVDDLINVLT